MKDAKCITDREEFINMEDCGKGLKRYDNNN